MSSFLIGLLVLAATIYLGLIYLSKSILMLAIAEALIMLLSFCYLWYQQDRTSDSDEA